MGVRIRARLTYANVISTVALFVALGGASYAALKLPANSIGTVQIRSNAVNSAKVQDGSLLGKDFKAGELPAGRPGANGQPGAPGSAGTNGTNGLDGTARAYAYVDPSTCTGAQATCTTTRSKSVSAVVHMQTGIYCVGVTNISSSGALAMAGVETNRSDTPYGNASAMTDSSGTGGLCPAGQFLVRTQRIPDTGQVVNGFVNTDASDSDRIAFWFAVP
jgi:hypothetical protein